MNIRLSMMIGFGILMPILIGINIFYWMNPNLITENTTTFTISNKSYSSSLIEKHISDELASKRQSFACKKT